MNFRISIGICFLAGSMACTRAKNPIVSEVFVDSLMNHYQEPLFARSNDSALIFWKSRIDPALPGFVSEMKYASALGMRFRLFGDIRDIKRADSTLRMVDSLFNHHEPAADLSLVSFSIQQHRFKEAEEWLDKAKKTGIKKYDLLTASFDVDFELGKYFNASLELKELKSEDYGYYFRRSKMDHLHGLLDSSIHGMERAAELEKSSPYLEQAAVSNAADLHMHAGELEQAALLYMESIRMNAADFHSLAGLAWIALVNDHRDSLAAQIYAFVRAKSQLPDVLYKLSLLAEAKGDAIEERKYAEAFAKQASDVVYGNMYNKYLIELYTGILQEPEQAEGLAKREMENRATPQTHAWLAWSLFSNHKKEAAMDQFRKYISGQPLEGIELYWMGKMMQGMNKGYNALAFFKAAEINKFDLSPGVRLDLEKQLQE
jgi:tetratricopeptide (TPR) repeat protein